MEETIRKIEQTPRWRFFIIAAIGLLISAFLLAMPFIFEKPAGDEAPDIVRFFGRFHPLVLHLPIGVFTLIFLQEILAIFTRYKPQESTVPIGFGALTAIAAVVFGFLLYQGGSYDGDLVEDHLWGGIAFSVLSIVTFLVRFRGIQKASSVVPYRVMLLVSVGVMSYASHDGASITHGKDYLFQYAPNAIRKVFGLEPKTIKEEKTVKPLAEQLIYADIIQPILEAKCVQCHKEGKSKGRFRMDTYELLLKGGKEGDSLVPGDAEDSNIVFRIELEEDDEEHMPPEGKADIESPELVVLKWWIDQGADPKKTVGELEMTDEVSEAFSELQELAELPPVEIAKAEKPKGPSEELIKQVAEFNLAYPGALSFESQAAADLTFTAVSMRKKFTDEDIKQLRPFLDKLVTANLTATTISDTAVEIFKSATKLRQIRLGETPISDRSLAVLAGIKSLKSINVYGTQITDEGLEYLKDLTNLELLYVWQTDVTAEAVNALKATNSNLEIIGATVEKPIETETETPAETTE